MTILISKYPVFERGFWWVEVIDVLVSGCRILKSKRFSNPYLAQAYCNVLRADPSSFRHSGQAQSPR